MSRVYDNWERLVGEVLKREQFRKMALAPPSMESSFRSMQSDSDLSSFASSSNHHDELVFGNSATGATPGEIAAKATLLFTKQIAYFRRSKQLDHSLDFTDPFGDVNMYLHERLSLDKLKVATDNFSNKNIVGRGGFGKVYKGRLADGTLVLVKRLIKEERGRFGEQFQNIVETSRHTVHRNIQRLRGFCMTPTERILVYPYMANGSVASCLRERAESQPPLDWPIRKRIALGSASGVAYLHDQCSKRIIHRNIKAGNILLDEDFEAVVGDQKIIHRDIKAANILLDEDFEAFVGDFGLAKLMDHEDTDVVTAVVGTFGHIAPEYLSTGKISEKTDVYGYGVMLLELITGQKAYDVAGVASDEDTMLLHRVKRLMREKKLEMLVDRSL